MMNKELKDITHGLMVIDPETDNGETVEIVHFVGYFEEPTKKAADHLRKELENDETFELQEIIDRCVILPAPPDIVESYKNVELENEED